jgi:HAMP domain-containing protein
MQILSGAASLLFMDILIIYTLRVIGDSGDKVEATGFNKSTAGDVANGITLGNVTYDVYINTSASTAELWIDQDLTVV